MTYCLVGSLFFEYFYKDTFALYINGNGGFVGVYLNKTFLNSFIVPYESVSYYILILLIIVIFLISINFSIKNFYQTLKKISLIIFFNN